MSQSVHSPDVSLVIAARNAERTIERCLQAVIPWLEEGQLKEIIVVNDGSTDRTKSIAESFGVTVITTRGVGRGAARNVGWKAASSALIWFIDSDCIAEPGALASLLKHFKDDNISGAGGSYGIAEDQYLLARLIHEEIVQRHLAMPQRVNFLATFNVIYRRRILEAVNGFDESLKLAQDAELAYRISAHGGVLVFDIDSRVAHFHPTDLLQYLKKQAHQGYWRVWLYVRHPAMGGGDSYSGWLDHLQPPLALLSISLIPLSFLQPFITLLGMTVGLVLLLQLPMTLALMRRVGASFGCFAVLGVLRAYARGLGLGTALLKLLLLQCSKDLWTPAR